MWGDAKRMTELREQVETLRRTVDALRYDLEELKIRVQRKLWRDKAEQRRDQQAEEEVDRGQISETGAPEAAASGIRTSASMDPVSRALHARRRRLPSPSTPSSNGSGE